MVYFRQIVQRRYLVQNVYFDAWEGRVLKTVSTSDLRAQIRRVFDEVSYGQAEYIVEKFGEPAAAIISMEDFRLLEEARRQQAVVSLRDLIADVRARNRQLDPAELSGLIEEARAAYHSHEGRTSDGR
jgi:prevent-host-death family protein